MSRGNHRQESFLGGVDRQAFLKTLEQRTRLLAALGAKLPRRDAPDRKRGNTANGASARPPQLCENPGVSFTRP